MVFDIHQIEDLKFIKSEKKDKHGGECYQTPDSKVFLVIHKNTIEVRTDPKLRNLLCEKYESVMTSRHFGIGGIEIVLNTQLSNEDIIDLIKLSYRLSN